MSPNDHLADQLCVAYDVYLDLHRQLAKRVMAAVGHTESDLTSAVLCPPCFYTLTKEEKLVPKFLGAMDGNNSLKLVDSSYQVGNMRADDRLLPSPRWIEPSEVDQFKDEVRRKVRLNSILISASVSNPSTCQATDAPFSEDPHIINDVAWLNVNELDDLKQCADACVERWKAAGPDAQKKMFDLFAIAGIFLCVCRHGHVLFICDMIRSGEL
jgi:hypothetical protein